MNTRQIDILNDYFLHSALHLTTLEEQCLRRLCAKDLSIRELHVIEAVATLQASEKNTMAEIAKYLHLSPASLTTAVNVLVKKEYLERQYSPFDRRVIYVHMTEKGSEANRCYLEFEHRMIRSVTEDVDEATADHLIEILVRLREFLESGTAEPADAETPED